MSKVDLHELAPGDILFVTWETTKFLPGVAADPVGYSKKHRADWIKELAELGIVAVPGTGLAKGTVVDTSGPDFDTPGGLRWRVSYGIKIVEVDPDPELEPLRAGLPILSLALLGLSAAAVIGTYNVTKPGSAGLNVLSQAAGALEAAGEGARELATGLKFALPLGGAALLVWLWRR